MTSQSESQRQERISELLKEAEALMLEYWALESQAKEKLEAAQAKYAQAKALMPLPLFPDDDK